MPNPARIADISCTVDTPGRRPFQQGKGQSGSSFRVTRSRRAAWEIGVMEGASGRNRNWGVGRRVRVGARGRGDAVVVAVGANGDEVCEGMEGVGGIGPHEVARLRRIRMRNLLILGPSLGTPNGLEMRRPA